MDQALQQTADRVAIQELIQRERAARDFGQWNVLAGSFHEDAVIDVSWFRGNGKQFAAESERMAANGLLTFHLMGATIVELRGDRALAETSGAIHVIRELGGISVDATSYARLYNRVERRDGKWLIAGFRVLYISDTITPLDPTRAPTLDHALLATFRPAYRFVSYLLAKSGHTPRLDLPGMDKPETLVALLLEEQEWLAKAP